MTNLMIRSHTGKLSYRHPSDFCFTGASILAGFEGKFGHKADCTMEGSGEGLLHQYGLDGCKLNIKAWLVAHTPDRYWRSTDKCIQSAINRAANRIDEHRTDTFAPRRLAAINRSAQRKC